MTPTGTKLTCWGLNVYDNLNPPLTISNNIPNIRFKYAAVGSGHTCAIYVHNGGSAIPSPPLANTNYKNTPQLECWGDNESLQSTVPPIVSHSYIRDFQPVAVQLGNEHTCALMHPGLIECWGNNLYGQCSAPEYSRDYTYNHDEILSSGLYHNCMSKYMSDYIVCWGSNTTGQLNNAVRKGDRVRNLVSGADSTCVLLGKGENGDRDAMRCWGDVIFKEGWYDFKRYVNRLGVELGRARVAMGFQLLCAVEQRMNWCDEYSLNYDLISDKFEDIPVIAPSELNHNDDYLDVSTGIDYMCTVQKGDKVKCKGSNLFGESDVPNHLG